MQAITKRTLVITLQDEEIDAMYQIISTAIKDQWLDDSQCRVAVGVKKAIRPDEN